MLEIESLIAFCLGASLVALTPVAKKVSGAESKVTKTIAGAGRSITKQSFKYVLMFQTQSKNTFKGIWNGVSEIGESFSDILAEAKADLAQSKNTKKLKSVDNV